MPVTYNDYIKPSGHEVGYSKQQLTELAKCMNDFWSFTKYIKIIHPDKGRIEFKPRDYQEFLLNKILNNRFTIGLWCRQSGKTTTISAYSLWYAIFNDDIQIGIVSNKVDSAKDVLDRIKIIYEELPEWIKPGVVEYAKKSITFENGSKIYISATTSTAFRGRTLNLLIMDEFAFVNRGQAEEFWASNYATISASIKSKIIIISTPNGLFNLFHRLWVGAKSKKNGFINQKVTWKSVPGRDQAWADAEKERLGPILFAQEQECDFIGSTSTLINATTLETLINLYEHPKSFEMNGNFHVFKNPESNCTYVLGVDTAKGTGNDFSVIQVLKIVDLNPIKFEQVAVYRSNQIETYTFAEMVNRIALYYNNAYIMVENNAEGDTIVTQLWWQYENMNLINYTSSNKKKVGELGIRATKTTKPKACLLLKRLIENGNLILKHQKTIEELSSFVEEKGKYFGNGPNDDCVTSLFWATFIFETKVLSEVTLGKNIPEEVGWGILSDFNNEEEDWSWVKKISLFD